MEINRDLKKIMIIIKNTQNPSGSLKLGKMKIKLSKIFDFPIRIQKGNYENKYSVEGQFLRVNINFGN